jgi:Cu-Zn family superoxide dismutase
MTLLMTLAAATAIVAGCATVFAPHDKRADAKLLPIAGSTAHGVVSFTERADGVQVSYNISGLPPNSDHALQIHERGDCNALAGLHGNMDIGGVFSPAAARLKQGARLEGDLANLRADADGIAAGFIVSTEVSLDGVRSVVGRSLIIHRDAQDYYAYPARDAGPALGCGVIR